MYIHLVPHFGKMFSLFFFFSVLLPTTIFLCSAENSKTPIHLSEFYMLEVEQSFVESLVDVTIFIEALIKNVTTDLLNKCNDDILTATSAKQKNAFSWLNKPFPTITYKEAISILEKEKTNIKNPIRPEDGLTKEQELFLVQYIDSPVFVVDWPQNMKPFYMRKSKTNAANVRRLKMIIFVSFLNR